MTGQIEFFKSKGDISFSPDENHILVIDGSIWEKYTSYIRSLIKKYNCSFYLLPPGERAKSFRVYQELCEFLIEKKSLRTVLLTAIGGGATSDLVGFVAATYTRGVRWQIIPTTLLAMVDAAIGGKVALNLAGVKNIIGQFHFPERVMISPEWLETLSSLEHQSARGEILKYCFLSKDIYELVMNRADLFEVIRGCANYKQKIVTLDPWDKKGVRALVNLGHTFGHAIEMKEPWPHGICVAKGIEMLIAYNSPELQETFLNLIKALEISLPEKKLEMTDLLPLMRMDKKNTQQNEVKIFKIKAVGDVSLETLII